MSPFIERLGNMKSSTIILVMLFLNNVYAQDFKLAGIHYAHYPNTAIKDVSGNQETSFHEFGAFLNFPKKFKNEKTVLLNGVGYGLVEATMYNFPSLQTSEYQKKLQLFYYQLRLVHKWNEKWALLFNLKPTVASDFEQNLSSNDFIIQGAVIATRTINDKLKIGAGAVETAKFGYPRVFPIVSLNYKSDSHRFNTLLPFNLRYTYSLLHDQKLKIGVGYERNGANFNIYSPNITEVDKINYSRQNIGVLAKYELAKFIRIEAFGGTSSGRIYRVVDVDGKVHEFDSKPSPFFSLGMVLIPLKRK